MPNDKSTEYIWSSEAIAQVADALSEILFGGKLQEALRPVLVVAAAAALQTISHKLGASIKLPHPRVMDGTQWEVQYE